MSKPVSLLCHTAGLCLGVSCFGQPGASAPDAPALDWARLEAPVLSRHVELTSRDDFVKAGEAYFSPDGQWVIFQAVPNPAPGKNADPFYSMYVARVTLDGDGLLSGLERAILVSPPGSANTCGWFHPTEPGRILLGSTLTPPATDQRAGFQVGQRKYTWLFPQETEVCTRSVLEMMTDPQRQAIERARASGNSGAIPGDLDRLVPMFTRPDYDAECSYSGDGRFVLYAHVREGEKTDGRADADIWVYDTRSGAHHALVIADGYDGGPFFSPDGRRICYRSDRGLNDLLQLFVADLKFDDAGVPIGIEREYQITDDLNVNWAPFWHPSGGYLVYGTSGVGHSNYEVFAIEIDDAKLKADGPDSRAADTLHRARLTYADGADVLPVFSPDGSWMMWTAQRGALAPGDSKPSSQLWAARFDARSSIFEPRGR